MSAQRALPALRRTYGSPSSHSSSRTSPAKARAAARTRIDHRVQIHLGERLTQQAAVRARFVVVELEQLVGLPARRPEGDGAAPAAQAAAKQGRVDVDESAHDSPRKAR